MPQSTARGVGSDLDPAALAGDLQARHRGYWLIYFSDVRQEFVAMPTWPLPPGRPLGARVTCREAARLLEGMYAQEQAAGVRRAQA